MEVLDWIINGLLVYLIWVMVATFVVLHSGDSNIDAFIDGVEKCRWGCNKRVTPKRRFVRTFCHYPIPLHKQLADMEWEERPFAAIARTGLTFEEACRRLHSIAGQDIGAVRPLIDTDKSLTRTLRTN